LHFHRRAHGSEGEECKTEFYLFELFDGGLTGGVVLGSFVLEAQPTHFSTMEMGSASLGVSAQIS